MIGAKQLDPVVGLDIHLFIIPPAPAPIPIPMPHIGVVMDPCDLIPMFATVRVNGVPRATAGSSGYCIPHPIPGAPVPAPPSNDHEILTGSLTVNADGEPLSRLGDLVLSCQSVGTISIPRMKIHTKPKNLLLPLSVLLSVPMGRPVLVGGPPMVSLFTMAFKAFGPLLKGLKKLRKGMTKLSSTFDNIMKSVSRILNKIKDNILAAISKITGKNLDNLSKKLSDDICDWTGHPVDVATGKVMTDDVDLELPGPLPLTWRRVWYSISEHEGELGHGWHHSYDLALHLNSDGALVRLADGRHVPFLHPGPDRPSWNAQAKLWLHRGAEGWWLEDLDGLQHHFGGASLSRRELPGTDGVLTLPLILVRDPNHNTVRLERDRRGHLTAIHDSAGRTLSAETDGRGRILSLSGPHPTQPGRRQLLVGYRYDGAGDLVEVVRAAGHPFRYAYKQHLLVEETDRQGTSFFFQYEGAGTHARCVRTWGDGGIFPRTLDYDLDSMCTRVADSRGTTVYHWDTRGLVHTREDNEGGLWKKSYDEELNLVEEQDALGNCTRRAYDERGRIVATTDAMGAKSELCYDGAGNLVEVRNALGDAWRYQYDTRRNVVAVTDPLGGAWTYEVDRRGLVLCATDPLGRETTMAWTPAGDLRAMRDRAGASTGLRHDAWGRLLVRTDPLGGETRLVWDLGNNLTEVTDASGRRARYTYDTGDNLLSATDPLGRTRRFAYGPRGVVVRVTEPSGMATRYDYDMELDLATVTDARDKAWIFRRDAEGRVVAEETFDRRRVAYERDAAGRLLASTKNSGLRTTYKRDSLGRLLEVGYNSGWKETLAYDPLGRLVAAEGPGAKVAWRYDALGRVLEETLNGETVLSRYDPLGNRLRRDSPGGHQVDYAYDPEGRLAKLGLDGAELMRLEVDGLGREVRRLLPAGVTSERSYLPTGELASSKTRRGGEVLLSREYHYNRAGEVEAIARGRWGTSRFTHDPDGRLVQSAYPDGEVERYLYDQAGNVPGVPDGRWDKDGRFHSEVDGWWLTYDSDGNLVEKARVDVGWRYTFDDAGRLAAVHKGPGLGFSGVRQAASFDKVELEARFAYDPLWRRVSKELAWAGGRREQTRFRWDGDLLAGEVREGGEALQREYVFRPQSWEPLVQADEGGRPMLIECDQIMTPTGAVDTVGEVIWDVEMGAWGGSRNGRTFLEFGPCVFPGQHEDVETSLVSNRYRYFDRELKLFNSADPLGVTAGNAPWNYVDCPLSWLDPLGLQKCKGTEPTLPDKKIAEGDGVRIEHNYRSGDHPTAHAHVVGGGPPTKIGPNGKPIKGQPELTSTQKAVVDANKSKIRKDLNKIGRWLKFHE